MRALSTLLLSLAFITCTGQDLLGKIYTQDVNIDIKDDIDSIVTYLYYTSYTEEKFDSDTLLITSGDTTRYHLSSKVVEQYLPDRMLQRNHYNNLLQLSYTEEVQLDAENRIVRAITQYEDEMMAPSMNAIQSFQYKNGKLSSVKRNDIYTLYSEFDDNEMPLLINMDLGMMGMTLERSNHENGIMYKGEITPGEDGDPFWELIKDKVQESPLQHVYITQEEGNTKFVYHEIERKNLTILSKETYIRNSKNQLIESLNEKNDTHLKMSYNEDGKLSETFNVKTGESLVNKFNSDGNYTVKHEGLNQSHYEYNSEGDLILEKSGYSDDLNAPNSFAIYKIYYK